MKPYILGLVALWCGWLFVPPFAAALHLPFARDSYALFSTICHQNEARSLQVAGYPLAVCARCSAIYFGFFAGVLLSPFLSRRIPVPVRGWWTIALAPMIIDVVLDTLGVHSADFATRLSTGAFFGVMAGLILTPVLETAFHELSRKWS